MLISLRVIDSKRRTFPAMIGGQKQKKNKLRLDARLLQTVYSAGNMI